MEELSHGRKGRGNPWLEFPCTGVSTFIALLHKFLVSLYFYCHSWSLHWSDEHDCGFNFKCESSESAERSIIHWLFGRMRMSIGDFVAKSVTTGRAGFCPDRQGPADNWLRPRCIWSHGEPSEWESSNICRKYCTCRGRIHLVTSDHEGEVYYEIVEHNWIRVLQSWSVSSRNLVTL